MSDIPRARAWLENIQAGLRQDAEILEQRAGNLRARADEIDQVLADLRRTMTKPRTSVKSQPMTAEVAEQIRAYFEENRDASNSEISRIFDVNPGRVSEAIAGKW